MTAYDQTAPDAGGHWCGWCRANPDKAVPDTLNALTYVHFMTDPDRELAMVYGSPRGSNIHLHELNIVDPLHLTVRAAIHRAFRGRMNVGGVRLARPRWHERPLAWVDKALDPRRRAPATGTDPREGGRDE